MLPSKPVDGLATITAMEIGSAIYLSSRPFTAERHSIKTSRHPVLLSLCNTSNSSKLWQNAKLPYRPSIFLKVDRISSSIKGREQKASWCICTAGREAIISESRKEEDDDDVGSRNTRLECEEEEDTLPSTLQVETLEEEAKSLARRYALSVSRRLQLDDELGDQGRSEGKQKRYKKSIKQEVPDHLLPKVAIVGRPNVGKSALFNRLVGGNVAIVVDEPGVTRDRLYGRSFWGEKDFMVIDTGGVVTVPKSQNTGTDGLAITRGGGEDDIAYAVKEAIAAGLPSMIEKQAAAAVKEASVIICLVDGQAGVTAADIEIVDWLRKEHSDKSIILAVNKCESPRKGIMQAADFWSLGFTPVPISAISGSGTGDLLDLVCSELKLSEALEETNEVEERIPAIAIVGRPNVGKSSLLNALVHEERTIVSPISGTTRDAIDTEFIGPDGQTYCLIDTAGIRRRAAVVAAGSKTESLSVNRAFQAIRRSDVVALVIDAMACITEQDYRIGERIEMAGKGCIIVVNKWDTIPDKNNQTTYFYEQDVREKLRVLSWAPIVYASATTGQRIEKIITAASAADKQRSKRISTSIFNQVVQEAVAFKQPPMSRGGKRGRVYYCTQATIRPPTFVFFVNDAKLFPETYRRYMEKQLRANIDFPGTPIRLLWRSKRKTDKKLKEKEKERETKMATTMAPFSQT